MALGSHLITVRRLEKYINDVIGKKANLPDTSKTIIGNISQINSDLTNNTCTNLINPTAQTQTKNGVTFTNNGDGTYTVNGTATEWTFVNINYIDSSTLSVPVGTYKLTGTPSNNGGARIQMMSIPGGQLGTDTGNGAICTVPQGITASFARIEILSGTTCNNLLFKPMITTDLNATYDDFVGYTGASGRLNEEVARLTPVQEQIVPSANIESGTTASQAYTVGAYLVFNGKLCKVTTAIAQGDTLAIGTNIEVTTVNNEMVSLKASINNGINSLTKYIPVFASLGRMITDALDIDTVNFAGDANMIGIVSNQFTQSMPSSCAYGVREVFWCNSTAIIIQITGIASQGGTFGKWGNFYNGTTWTGWERL